MPLSEFEMWFLTKEAHYETTLLDIDHATSAKLR